MDYRVNLWDIPWHVAILAFPIKFIYTFVVRPARFIKNSWRGFTVLIALIIIAVGLAWLLSYLGIVK